MTNITTAKKILNSGNQKLSDEQVKLVLETLSMMASLQLITEEKKLNNEKNNKRDSVLPSEQ